MKKQVHLPFVGKKVEDLVLWRSPKESGLIFGLTTAAFLAYQLNPFNAATTACYLLAIASLAAFLWAQLGHLVHRSGPPVPHILTKGLSDDDARKMADAALPAVNKALATVGLLASGSDLKLSLVVVVGAYVGARLFTVVSPLTLAYVVALLGFTLPKLYEAKQEEVDRLVAAARGKLTELEAKFKENVLSKIPKASHSPKKTT